VNGYEKDIADFEFNWTRQNNYYPKTAQGDPITVSKKLWDKYGMKMQNCLE